MHLVLDYDIPSQYVAPFRIIQVPGAAPTNIAAVPLSASSLNVTWSEIAAEKRYGIIVSYKLKYMRADGNGVQKDVVVKEKFCVIEKLAQSVAYEIAVTGMTIKGDGVFSSKLTVSTGEDGKGIFLKYMSACRCNVLAK